MTDDQSKKTEQQIETQRQCIQIIARHIEAQRELLASLRASLARKDERLDALIDIVREGRNGQS